MAKRHPWQYITCLSWTDKSKLCSPTTPNNIFNENTIWNFLAEIIICNFSLLPIIPYRRTILSLTLAHHMLNNPIYYSTTFRNVSILNFDKPFWPNGRCCSPARGAQRRCRWTGRRRWGSEGGWTGRGRCPSCSHTHSCQYTYYAMYRCTPHDVMRHVIFSIVSCDVM